MKRFLAILLLASGCSLHADYVRQDRANYETWAPLIRRYVAETDIYSSTFEQDQLDRLEAWDAWTTAGVASIDSD
jgi:hypothetical protein